VIFVILVPRKNNQKMRGTPAAATIMTTPVEDLVAEEDFKESCRLMGFATLQDIAALSPEELMKKKGFSYGWLRQLVTILRKNGLTDLLQPLPGNNPG
jgi:hypothetical protein